MFEDLYKSDYSKQLENKVKKLLISSKEFIYILLLSYLILTKWSSFFCLFLVQYYIERIQKNINTYTNYRDYELHRKNEEITSFFKNLAKKYQEFLDTDEKEFIKKFPGNYKECIFELAMARFVSKNFSYIEQRENRKKGEPDIIFYHNEKKYFLECSTGANTSLMKEFYEELPKFNDFYKMCLKLKEKCESSSYEDKALLAGHYSSHIEYLAPGLTSDEIIQLKRWMKIQYQAYTYYREIIPQNIADKLVNIVKPVDSVDSIETEIIKNLIIERVILKMKDKTKKEYFNEDTSVIISLSLVSPVAMLDITISGLINADKEIFEKINNRLTRSPLQSKLKNLYAIIIDTTWYNWAPEIASKRHGATFKNVGNYFHVIYNQNISSDLNCDSRIFDNIVGGKIAFF